jgi:hypothetical protein
MRKSNTNTNFPHAKLQVTMDRMLHGLDHNKVSGAWYFGLLIMFIIIVIAARIWTK